MKTMQNASKSVPATSSKSTPATPKGAVKGKVVAAAGGPLPETVKVKAVTPIPQPVPTPNRATRRAQETDPKAKGKASPSKTTPTTNSVPAATPSAPSTVEAKLKARLAEAEAQLAAAKGKGTAKAATPKTPTPPRESVLVRHAGENFLPQNLTHRIDKIEKGSEVFMVGRGKIQAVTFLSRSGYTASIKSEDRGLEEVHASFLFGSPEDARRAISTAKAIVDHPLSEAEIREMKPGSLSEDEKTHSGPLAAIFRPGQPGYGRLGQEILGYSRMVLDDGRMQDGSVLRPTVKGMPGIWLDDGSWNVGDPDVQFSEVYDIRAVTDPLAAMYAARRVALLLANADIPVIEVHRPKATAAATAKTPTAKAASTKKPTGKVPAATPAPAAVTPKAAPKATAKRK